MAHPNSPSITPLTTEQMTFLNNYLCNRDCMDIFTVHGFLTATISSPVDMPANEWLPLILGMGLGQPGLQQDQPIFSSDEEAQKVILALDTLKEQITEVLNSNKLFHPLVSLDDPKMSMFKAPTENVQNWCNGYLHGVDIHFKAWSIIDKVFVPLVPFAVVSGAYPYEDLVQGLDKFLNKEEDIKYCMETIPPSVKSLYRFWRANNYAEMVKGKINPKLRDAFKLWNDKCSCGSGKNFGACCAQKPI